MKKKLIQALGKWFTGAAAVRLAGALLDALFAGLAGKASPKVIAALRALVLALAEERADKASATIAADLSRQGLAAINEATVRAVEMAELAQRLYESLPPEDPRAEALEHREDALPYLSAGIAGPIGDAVPPEPAPGWGSVLEDDEEPLEDSADG